MRYERKSLQISHSIVFSMLCFCLVTYSHLMECLWSHSPAIIALCCSNLGLRGLKGPGPALPEVKIKNLINEENLLSFIQRDRERARHRVISGWNLLSGDNQYPASYAMRQRQDVSHDCLGNVCCKYSPIHYIPQQIW